MRRLRSHVSTGKPKRSCGNSPAIAYLQRVCQFINVDAQLVARMRTHHIFGSQLFSYLAS
jgi:hypothetical protein